MARSEREHEPVTEAEFEGMPERISRHFDRVRDHLDDAFANDAAGGDGE